MHSGLRYNGCADGDENWLNQELIVVQIFSQFAHFYNLELIISIFLLYEPILRLYQFVALILGILNCVIGYEAIIKSIVDHGIHYIYLITALMNMLFIYVFIGIKLQNKKESDEVTKVQQKKLI